MPVEDPDVRWILGGMFTIIATLLGLVWRNLKLEIARDRHTAKGDLALVRSMTESNKEAISATRELIVGSFVRREEFQQAMKSQTDLILDRLESVATSMSKSIDNKADRQQK